MARDGGSRQADHWQRKYYDALAELEEKEKAWVETEALLRRLATRLTLAADHRDPALDRLLDDLRRALRNERNPHRLQKLVEEVSGVIARLDDGKSPAADPAAPLKTVFARLPVPEAFVRQRRFVERQLEKADTPDAARKVAGDLAELVLLLLERRPPDGQATHEPGASEAAPDDEGGGFIASLFGRRREREAARTPAEDEAQAPEPVTGMAALGAEPEQCRHAAETLIRLLEQSHWPDPLHAEAELLKRRLEACRDETALREGLLATAELFNGLQAQVQREKQELEAFLRQLTERLAELDRDIRTTA
ncbi:MAG TPA: hypothetical protein ENI93_02665, partial [Gammaproteobacteria bacterium]|nr:hypothetical protein [Gammaproteobacteria bacterium]